MYDTLCCHDYKQRDSAYRTNTHSNPHSPGLSPEITALIVSFSPSTSFPQTPSSPSDRSPVRNNSQNRPSTRPSLCDRYVGSPSRSPRTNRTVPMFRINTRSQGRRQEVLTLNSVILNPSATNGLSETILAPSFRSRKRLTRSALRAGGKTSLLTSFVAHETLSAPYSTSNIVTHHDIRFSQSLRD